MTCTSPRSSTLLPAYWILLVIVAAGCAGTQKRFEQGVELEAKGRWLESARRYIQVLRKDPGREDARARLEDVGPRAVDGLLADADRLDPVRSAETLKELERLADEAWSVGVDLPLPATYDSLRADAFFRAVRDLMQRGRAAEARGAWAEAIRSYDRIPLFEPDADARAAADEAAVGAYLRWGSAELEAGRYLSALGKVDEVLERLDGAETRDRPEIGAALSLREEVVRRGTVFVVFTPIGRGEVQSGRPPRDFVDELNDVLELEAWTRPPVLIATVDPAEVRRELRREGWNRDELSARDAARLGRDLDADFVVTGTVTRYRVEEFDVKRSNRAVKTVQGRDTTYAEVAGRLRIDVAIEMQLVETRSRRVVDRFELLDNESGRFERAEYAGDYRDLRLSREERRLFDEDRRRESEWAVGEALIRSMNDRIARGVFEDIRRMLQ